MRQNGEFAETLTPRRPCFLVWTLLIWALLEWASIDWAFPMARSYSAVMALIGLLVVVLRGMKDGAGFDGTIASGLCWMILLGSIGFVAGFIAAQTVDESVRTKIEAELASVPAAGSPAEST